MTLTAGQTRWLNRQVGEERTGVVDGRVADSVVDGDERVVTVLGATGTATFRTPSDIAPSIGESSAVMVVGDIAEWLPSGDGATLVVRGDNGEFRETVIPPRTDAEQRDWEARRAREAEEARIEAETAAAEAQRQAREARIAREAHIAKVRNDIQSGTTASLKAALAALADEVYGPPPAPTDPPGPTPPAR